MNNQKTSMVEETPESDMNNISSNLKSSVNRNNELVMRLYQLASNLKPIQEAKSASISEEKSKSSNDFCSKLWSINGDLSDTNSTLSAIVSHLDGVIGS